MIIDELPEEGVENVIYLIPTENTNNYIQWMWIGGEWADLGGIEVDLSNYYTKAEIDSKIAAVTLAPSSSVEISESNEISAIGVVDFNGNVTRIWRGTWAAYLADLAAEKFGEGWICKVEN